MAGAGRRVFQPGEVLTASNVMSYLQDQAVMVFDSSAARGSAIGTATVSEGMVTYLKDANEIQYYDGSAWRSSFGGTAVLPIANGGTGGTSVATAQDNIQIGLVNLIPSTVTVTGTGSSASANGQGKVTFTSATSISLNGVFSSAYNKYLINFELAPSAAFEIRLRMRNAGTDRTGANYAVGAWLVRDNAVTSTVASAGLVGSPILATGVGGYFHSATINIFNPADGSKETNWNFLASSVSSSIWEGRMGAGRYSIGDTNDSFTLIPTGAGNITGSVQCFAYNE